MKRDDRSGDSLAAAKVKEQTETYDVQERYEIIQGVRYEMQPSPSFLHQVIVFNMAFTLRQSCHETGIVVVAPMDVHLDADNTVQPDLIFIRNGNLHIVQNNRIKGTPDLLAEVLSPSTGKHDRARKKALYESFGVTEYWIVDPAHYTIEQYELDAGSYRLAAVYGEGDTIRSNVFSCIHIDVTSLFAEARRFE
ncbi:Uma2 family endonuclease [Paenibacillus chartarius]|uniref:Uma2 family endonuclease n=1 Tax=Paenibacillus chartarius TaxID=747481 RepID=A0ABV6DPI4_9BACL